MPIMKCVWDNSHKYEVSENEQYKTLCKSCYHNIYMKHYQSIYPFYDFVKNIKAIRIQHQLKEMIDEGCDFKAEFDLITNKIKKTHMKCLMDGKEYYVSENEEFRFLCKECFKKYYLPLKPYFTANEIETILTGIKEDGSDIDAAFEEVLKNAKENTK